MILTPEARQAIRLANRQVTLKTAQNNGIDPTIEATQCIIDGLADALADLDGHRGAFAYAANLSDRLARGIRGATAIPQALKRKNPAPPAGGALGFWLDQ